MSLARRLADEHRTRLAAERLLELKQAELFAVKRQLRSYAKDLSNEIVEKREEVEHALTETERVKSALLAAHRKTEIAENRLWSTIASIRDGFAFFDENDGLIAANPSFLSVFADKEIVRPGVTYGDLLTMVAEQGVFDTGDLTADEWRSAMLTRWHSPSPEPMILKMWNGEYIKLVEKRGKGGEVLSIATNMTDAAQYEAKLQAEQMRADSAMRAKSAFLTNMSHEIRTSMNGVVAMADLLMDTTLNEEQRLFVSTIKNSGEALLVIIDDILDFSKIEADQLDLRQKPFDLERCIHETMMLLQLSAQQKGLEINVDYDLFLPTLFIGDPGRLRQILTNLVGNAVKFTAQGHILVRVVGIVPQQGSEAQLHVTVQDTGIGIPPNKIDHIFGEFNQAQDTSDRAFDGAGLGLAISRRLISLMAGEIWVDSTEGEGASFGFKLSLPVNEDCESLPMPMPANVRHVLIADQTDITNQQLQQQLRQRNTRVSTCKSGERALSLARQVDLVLADDQLPEIGGLELAETLRRQGVNIPVIVFGTQTEAIARDPRVDIIQGILKKPASRGALFLQIAEATKAELPDLISSPPPGQNPTRRMRLLAADDNETNRLILQKMLQSLEIDLECVSDGLEAVEAYKRAPPDLVFMDISMPKMDGKEATRSIRDLENTSEIRTPIVALTAHAVEGDKEGILSSGLDHFLTKPVRKPALFDLIKQYRPPDACDPFADVDMAKKQSQLSG